MYPKIPKSEFTERISKARKLMELQGIDLLFTFGNEMEPQYQKYFSDFWPSFETAAVLISCHGGAVLLVGPESRRRAYECGMIEDVRSMNAFRESASPVYYSAELTSFDDVIEDITGGRHPKKVSIAGSRLLPFDIFTEFAQSLKKYGNVEIIDDNITDTLRMNKSENEIACIRHACDISHQTMQYLLSHIHEGMTELNIKGLALSKMHELGAEGEAYPMWILSGPGSNFAIGRARQKAVLQGELIQLQIGARYEGYASSIARPVILGRPEQWMKDSILALYEGYDAVLPALTDGNSAGNAALQFAGAMKENGYYSQLLYGPCHGLGIAECEAPWVEESAGFTLKKGMTFGLDLYIENKDKKYGIRVEDSICITEGAPLNMTDFPREIFVL